MKAHEAVAIDSDISAAAIDRARHHVIMSRPEKVACQSMHETENGVSLSVESMSRSPLMRTEMYKSSALTYAVLRLQ